MPLVIVVAAVIERDGRFLITRRLKDTHLAGYWEFPGGKCEPDETHEACLIREIAEELHARVAVGAELISVEHTYTNNAPGVRSPGSLDPGAESTVFPGSEDPGLRVRLHFHACHLLDEPTPMLGQEMQWIARADLRTLDFPEADRSLIDLLTGVSPQGG